MRSPKLVSVVAVVICLVFLTSCSGFSNGSSNTLTPDFNFLVNPTAAGVSAGNTTTISASITPQDGFSGTVQLNVSGLPAGVSASYSSQAITGAGSATITISAAHSVTAGSYMLAVTGASGSLTHSQNVQLAVSGSGSSADFSFSASPASQTVTAGNSTTFSTGVSAVNDFSGMVTLGVSGLTTGLSASFSPTSITASGSSTLTVTTSKSLAAGNYPLTIIGSSGSLSHSASVSVVVTAPPSAVALNVLQAPGASGDPWFADVATYLYSNSVVNGTTIAIEWSAVDQGPSAGSSQYDWSYPDGQAQPWIQAGKKVNFVVWANADEGSTTCGPWGQYGANNTGNCAIPSYVWTALGSSNYTSCTSSYGTQQMPNYLASAFQSNYQAFVAAMVQHYANNANIGYIRFGLGHGGESLPVANWNDTTTACGQAYVNTWGLTVQSWENYLSTMLNYEGSLNSTVQLMAGVTPMGNPGDQVPDYEAPIAVQNGIGFGSQGLQLSDVNNCAGATADWCELFNQYTGQVPLELQTYAQSCPDNTCQTGSLSNLIPFAVANHATIFEIYYQDWLTAYDPNYPGYYPGYQSVFATAVGQ